MKQQPDYPDDFISSAGVPTIPLKAPQQRGIDVWVLAVTSVLLCITALFGSERLFAFILGLPHIALWCAVTGVLSCIIGIVSKVRISLFVGFVFIGTSLSILLFDALNVVTIPLFFVISLVAYRMYTVRILFIRERWPLLLAVIAGVASVCEVLYVGGYLSPDAVMPLTISVTIVLLIAEIRRTIKKRQ